MKFVPPVVAGGIKFCEDKRTDFPDTHLPIFDIMPIVCKAYVIPIRVDICWSRNFADVVIVISNASVYD